RGCAPCDSAPGVSGGRDELRHRDLQVQPQRRLDLHQLPVLGAGSCRYSMQGGSSYLGPMVTLLLAPLTERSAVLGKASLMLPSPGFWIAPAPIETLPAVAPFSRATGMATLRSTEPPQRLVDTDNR